MRVPGSKSRYVISRVILRYGNQILKNPEIEWYSGTELYTRPKRVKINEIWEDICQYEKSIRENTKGQREVVFRCHIGDNRIIEVVIAYTRLAEG